jgi:cobalt-zinc-cadmium efflux system outer membrane protein
MPPVSAIACALAALVLLIPFPTWAEPSGALMLTRALQRALGANPRLTAAERDIGIAASRRIQAGALPNPEVYVELDKAFGTGEHRGVRRAETTLQLGQLIELGGKREARVAAGTAELEAARWQRAAVRLEILSDTAVAFFSVLGAQRRIQIYDTYLASLDRLTPLLQRRVDAGASPPAEIARAQLAADLVHAERERVRTALAIARRELATLMGVSAPDFPLVLGDLGWIGKPPPFQTVLRSIDGNPQLVRWTSIRAQRDAELLSARLKPIPDLRAGVAWRHFNETKDDAVLLGLSIPIPVWDQNAGGILAAQESRAKVEAELAAARTALILTLGRAYEILAGSAREIEMLRASALPNARRAVEGMESGYSQGRFTLLELLDVQNAATQASLRELEALINFHTAVATIEGLTGMPLGVTRERIR